MLETGPFDWYQHYSALHPFVRKYILSSSRVLMLGQALSTRPDIMPTVYCQELAKLQNICIRGRHFLLSLQFWWHDTNFFFFDCRHQLSLSHLCRSMPRDANKVILVEFTSA
ncbi:hypothetical protein NE237_026409 [Protea cynaroides]|uniref:Uncharacterized protein n=1 Tax=Protea cynaroides TaxID=273540 RepID=A0A9Q0K2P6_9MAGN|nr:hypothetical protein NE237_026409 [Protea cynaroides]